MFALVCVNGERKCSRQFPASTYRSPGINSRAINCGDNPQQMIYRHCNSLFRIDEQWLAGFFIGGTRSSHGTAAEHALFRSSQSTQSRDFCNSSHKFPTSLYLVRPTGGNQYSIPQPINPSLRRSGRSSKTAPPSHRQPIHSMPQRPGPSQ